MSLQDFRLHIREQRHLMMLVLIVRRYVGRSVCGMANESFDNLVTGWVYMGQQKNYSTIDENVRSIV